MATFQDIQDKRAEVRKEFGQRIADYPNQEAELRKKVYGEDKVLPALRQTKDNAIMELWNTDRDLASRYANPESDMFIEDPYQRESLVAGRHNQIFENVSQLTRAEEQRSSSLG